MALFKISKGASGGLNSQALGDGYCWFTYDDGKFYIDYKDPTDDIVKRKALNADMADKDSLGNIIHSSYAASLDFTNNILQLLDKNNNAIGLPITIPLDNYKTKQTAITDPSASGSATAFIDTISQDANGVITVTKKNLPSTTLATDTGTSAITLTHGGKYKLTAAGSSVIFTMPSDNNTTYTFANGTNGFTVTPSGGSAQTVTVTPSIANNITGSGTSGYLTKFNGKNTITNGPQLSSAISNQSQTTKFLREDGTWAAPSYTRVKGNAETNYRTGDVNLTPANIGAATTSHTHGNITNDGKLGTASRVVITDENKKITISSVTSTELEYLSGVTSTIQTQINAKAPLASPELTGTPKAPTADAGTNTTQIATTEFVTRAVSQGFVANDAMVFKGLIGSNQTITQLPTSGYNAGWTYRVADAGTFAGEYCEVGDLLIAINDGPASGSSVIGADWGKVEHNIDGAVFRGAGASNSSVGSSTQPVYVNASGVVTAITGAIVNDTTGNAATATVASKLSNTSKIGDTNKPVYFKADGTPTEINYTISESVPSGAVFTDTTYTFNTIAQTNKIQYKATGASSWTDVPITVSITNNITGSGTSGSLAKFNGTNAITTGPSFSNAISSQDQTTKFLREDGIWSTPTYTTSTVAAQIIRW